MLVAINGASGDHGCTNYAIVRVNLLSEQANYIGQVIEAQSCHSCWQVGHDQNYTFLTEGQMVCLRGKDLHPVLPGEWRADVSFVTDTFRLLKPEEALGRVRFA